MLLARFEPMFTKKFLNALAIFDESDTILSSIDNSFIELWRGAIGKIDLIIVHVSVCHA